MVAALVGVAFIAIGTGRPRPATPAPAEPSSAEPSSAELPRDASSEESGD
jgi:hypothetical protein